MMHYHDLRGRRLRRHRRFLAKVQRREVVYIRTEPEFRMAARLHYVGLVTACVSKENWIGPFNGHPFRELAVYTSEVEALKHYYRTLPRRRA
jgi:hypothetical protein